MLPPVTMVTGASGFLGKLVAAALLIESGCRLLLPIRASASRDACRAQLRDALSSLGAAPGDLDALTGLATLIEMPAGDYAAGLDGAVRGVRVDEVIHCAGCLDYFATRELELANVELTSALLQASRRWGVGRFVYLSTAFSAGYRGTSIGERLHPDPAPGAEPTEYTRTKRIAERRVAESGLPYLIVRPSIVIGDSRSGNYVGRNYGLYQMWRAWEALLSKDYSPVWYVVAPHVRLNFVHQDAFAAGFIAALRGLPADSIVHLVSRHATSPTMRELCWLWADVYRPAEIRCYDSVDAVPLATLPVRQRRFLEIVAKNLEIATHAWRFDDDRLEGLRARGASFVDATLDSVARCQRRYVVQSATIQQHLGRSERGAGNRPALLELA